MACCKTLAIEDEKLDKPKNQWCPHVDFKIKGCGIHEEKPASCRNFVCMWLVVPEMPDTLRPDRCGVVFFMTNPEKLLIQAHLELERGEALSSSRDVRKFVATALSRGFKIAVTKGDQRGMLSAEDRVLTLTALDGGKEVGPTLRVEGKK